MTMLSTFLLMAAPQGAEGAAEGGNYSFLIMMGLIFVVMYFLMIRPQQKRQKQLNEFRKNLSKGTKVITAGGIYGKIKDMDETSVVIESEGTTLRMDKSMIMRDPSDIAQK